MVHTKTPTERYFVERLFTLRFVVVQTFTLSEIVGHSDSHSATDNSIDNALKQRAALRRKSRADTLQCNTESCWNGNFLFQQLSIVCVEMTFFSACV